MKQFVQPLRQAVANPRGELEVALCVSQMIDPANDYGMLREQVDHFFQPLRQQRPAGANDVLSWFKQRGFGQSTVSEVSLQHSDIAWVIRQQSGIPISLAVLVMEAARRCELSSVGINFPGHFLLKVDQQLIDPVSMSSVAPNDFMLDDSSPPMPTATPTALALRMLNNLKMIYVRDYQWQVALELVDLQLAITEQERSLQAALLFEQGEYWQQLGGTEAARLTFERCLAIAEDPALRRQVMTRLNNLQGDPEVWH